MRGCLALYHEIIPACRGLEAPAAIFPENSPLHLPRSSRYWLRNRADGPRRAGISVRGVDGSCSHVVLEGVDSPDIMRSAPLGSGTEMLFAVAGESSEELLAQLDTLEESLRGSLNDDFYALAASCHDRYAVAAKKARAMAMVARGRD